ncbi:hypothetical protein HGP14_09440 [Rhizobium sp. P32RR-XVIII]|uniref:hypothetical protein n=1 Tax=Rhizobium sp. P32RR-XVIII TaxID=2726738 RepID=UPI00145774F3|nr:hypothetical protein [Rhizobium sp. P32RR-XVIII]NLS03580.1 hypothetical protein [Rhizobium sp. P32RR-XVIII]
MMQKTYTLEEDFAPILKGDIDIPNAEDVDPMLFLSNLASGGHSWVPKWGWGRVNGQKNWAQFFLTPAGMGGRFDGGGYAVVWRNGIFDQEAKKTMHRPLVVRFAICKHEEVDAPGANHSRGWHPGSCRHCGLDMTVDSGD